MELNPIVIEANKVITQEKITETIRELAGKLQRRPTMLEVCELLGIVPWELRRVFPSYAVAVESSGLEALVKGALSTQAILEDWRAVVRKLGRIPTIKQYDFLGQYSVRPLKDRFGAWKDIPAGMLEFGDRTQLWAGWEDVRELAQRYVENRSTSTVPRQISTLDSVDMQSLYGGPLSDLPLMSTPINEMGVVLLFGALARKLGFVVLNLHAEFPDCEALRQVDDYRWRKLRIEFEFQSRSFLDHGHNAEGCDLIVCWEHNWAECTNQVLELKKLVLSEQEGSR
jgi:Homing endonuclease associated repeat